MPSLKVLFTTAVAVLPVSAMVAMADPDTPEETVVYDEARSGDLGPAKPSDDAKIRVSDPGVHTIKGTGADAVDDCDAFVFEVACGEAFDFCLVGDAAEFKKLRSIDPDGTVKEIAFGSTNLTYGVPRNIIEVGLKPGEYHVEMFFGPGGAGGDWVVKIAPRSEASSQPLFKPPVEITAAEKASRVAWQGVSIFHGHNWGDDEKYLLAIKEAGFNACGCTEWQIDDLAKHGLRAFVFIWPHEAKTIPAQHKNNEHVLAYYLSDRIPPSKWGYWAGLENDAYHGDIRHPAIFTMKGTWGGIDQFLPAVRARAMEYYHYHWDGNRHPHMHFAILQQFRAASRESNHVPLCRVVETRPEDMRKTRQTIFTSLAYGFRGFRWGGSGLFDANNRDKRGVPTRTKCGDEALKINEKLVAYLRELDKAQSEAVFHTPPLPGGTRETPPDYWACPSGPHIVMGEFDDGQRRLLLLANRDHTQPHTATVTFRKADVTVHRMNTTNADWQPETVETEGGGAKVAVKLGAGDAELFSVVAPW